MDAKALPADVYIAIDDTTLRVIVRTWRTRDVETYPVGFLPIEVLTWIHYIEKRFGEPELF